MLQIRTTVENRNVFLDLYQNEPVFLSLSFAELQDITKKNSAFSKGFALPGSKKNNEIFNFFYDLNAIPTDFNPNNKFPAQILWAGYELFQGHIRLDGVTIGNGGEIIYQVTFYNQVGDLMANIGDKFLFDTNLSGLTHPYSQEVILKSLYDPTLFPLTGTTDYSYENGETMWGLYNIGYEYVSGNTVDYRVSPLIQFTSIEFPAGGPYTPQPPNFDFSGSPVQDYYFKPTLQIKALYESICAQAGYEIESEFFNTDYFKHYYMPLKFLDETIYAKNAIVACFKYGPQSFELTDPLTRVYTVPNSGVTCNSLNYPLLSTSFFVNQEFSGEYTYRFTMNLQGFCLYGPSFNTPSVEIGIDDGTTQTIFYSTTWCDNSEINTVSVEQTFNFTGNSNVAFYLMGDYAEVTDFTVEIINGPRFLPTGTPINYAEEFPTNDYTQIDFITSINKYFNLVVVPNPDKPKSLIVEPIIDYIGKGGVLDWTTKIDYNQPQSLYPTNSLVNGTLFYDFKLDQDYANQDFKGQSNRTFGTDKFKLNQEYKDAETKFDYMFSSPIDITINNSFVPLLTVSSMSKLKSVDVAGQPQQTFVPFKVLPKLIFRGPTLPTDNWGFVGDASFISGSALCTSGITYTTNSTGGQPLFYEDCFNNTQVYYGSVSGSNTLPFCANPNSLRFTFPLFPIPTLTVTFTGNPCTNQVNTAYQSWYMDNYQLSIFNNLNRFTTYPFNYNDLSHYCNFRGEDKTNITPSEYSFVAPDLYDIYYRPYVEDLISEENKIYKAKIYLYPQDIQGLRWNERILINNTYFRINQINNFNVLEPGICDIELVKLTKEYEGHRVLYYDLTPCSGGTVLHTNSDKMYHLYAYANRYVRLFDDSLDYLGCYGVSVVDFDETYTYNHYYLSSGYTDINIVNVYPDCGCVGRSDMDLVQQTPVVPITPTPTPTSATPTPTPTKTLTPTPTKTPTPTPAIQFPCSCYEIVITSPGGEGPAGGVTYNNCVTDAPEGLTFLSAGTYYQCGVTDSMVINIGTGTVTEISDCNSGCPPTTPTPTPTVSSTQGTTPTPTPTITNTPSVTSTGGLTPTPSPTNTQTPTPSTTLSLTPTPTVTPTASGGACPQIYLYPNNTNACDHSGSFTLYETDDLFTPTRFWLFGECGITPVTGGNLWFSQGPAADSYQVDNGGFVIATTSCP
jgi:hypothetical protein